MLTQNELDVTQDEEQALIEMNRLARGEAVVLCSRKRLLGTEEFDHGYIIDESYLHYVRHFG